MKVKEKSLSILIKELDTVFSLFIRLRDSDGAGTVTCFVTGERVWWKDAQAAHFISRGKMPTRYHEQNVHACTIDSNQYDDHHTAKYFVSMVKKYGHSFTYELSQVSQGLQKFTRPEITDLIELYTEKVKTIRKEKGL